MVVYQPHKLGGEGSSPSPAIHADIAQLVELLSCKQRVVGSIPTVG